MTQSPILFSPINIGSISLDNRIIVSPMCQYSAVNGVMQPWHSVHLGSLAISGAGLLFIEATAVNAEGRITPGCAGLYNDDTETALRKVVSDIRSISDVPLAMQLAHAGRKASSASPWNKGQLIPVNEGGWHPVAPSALAHKPEEPEPLALDQAGLNKVLEDFKSSTRRSLEIGFEIIEIHMAHGYLLHQFLSPIANKRNDEYGGSLENRMRFPLAVFDAVKSVIDEYNQETGDDTAATHTPLGVRISASDWDDSRECWDLEQSVELCKALQSKGCDFMDVSSGGVSDLQKIKLQPGYQVPFAQRLKSELEIPIITVGLITEPSQAEDILVTEQADAVALARGFLHDPRWPWRAAAELGGSVKAPPQYWRSVPGDAPRAFGDISFGQR